MKTILVSAALWLLAVGVHGQEKTVTVDSKSFGSATVYFRYRVNLERKDTFNSCSIVFTDEQYKVLKSYESIVLSDQEDIDLFKGVLSSAISALNEKSTINWDKPYFKIDVYDFSSYIYVYSINKKSYFTIGNRNAEKLIQYLSEFTLGSNANYYANKK